MDGEVRFLNQFLYQLEDMIFNPIMWKICDKCNSEYNAVCETNLALDLRISGTCLLCAASASIRRQIIKNR